MNESYRRRSTKIMSFRERSLERSSNSGGRLRMDRNPQPSRINDPSLAAGRRKEIDNLMKKARKDPNDYWDKKILEVEERDPNRWRHTGYKKMYVDEEKSSNGGRSRSISPRARRPPPPAPKSHSRYSPPPKSHSRYSPPPRRPLSPVGRAPPHSPPRRPISPVGRRSPDMRKHVKPAPYRRPPSPPQPIRSSSSSSSSSSEPYYRNEKYSRSRTPTQARQRVIRSPSYQVSRKVPPIERERVERERLVKPKGPPPPGPSSSSSSHRKQVSPKPRVTSTSDDYVSVREREKVREHRAAAATTSAPPVPVKVNKHKKVRKSHKHADVKIKVEDEPKRAPRSPRSPSSSSSSSSDDNSVIFTALNSNTKLTLSERFGKIAQWSVDRSNMENMRITKNKSGGDLKVLIEEGIQSPTNPRRRSYTPVRPDGHFPEELLAEGPADLGSWDDVAVRYNYYKSIGYLRGLGLSDYMKWEEWWWQYQAWLRRCEQWERGQMNRRRRRKIPITARLN